jgi:hypothetical protein
MTEHPYTKISDNGNPSRPQPDQKISDASKTYNPKTFTDQPSLARPMTPIPTPDLKNLKNPNPNEDFVPNPNFSPFKFYFFMFIHCMSALYVGFNYTGLSCLGKPIIHSSLKIYDRSSVDHWLGLFNLAFGLGKMTGSLIAGSFAKAIGKIHVLYLAEIFNVASCTLIYFPSPGLFLAGRVIAGICCGFITTTAPRLILENYPTNYRGVPTSVYGVFLTIGICWSCR